MILLKLSVGESFSSFWHIPHKLLQLHLENQYEALQTGPNDFSLFSCILHENLIFMQDTRKQGEIN